MKEAKGIKSRVDGRLTIRREIMRLMIKTARFAQFRAAGREDHLWAGRVYDALEQTLRLAREEERSSGG